MVILTDGMDELWNRLLVLTVSQWRVGGKCIIRWLVPLSCRAEVARVAAVGRDLAELAISHTSDVVFHLVVWVVEVDADACDRVV